MKATITIISELISLKIARIPIISTSWRAETQTSTTTYVFKFRDSFSFLPAMLISCDAKARKTMQVRNVPDRTEHL